MKFVITCVSPLHVTLAQLYHLS